ncbi:MAG: hypothetical protein ABJA57_11730 [Ginsengibacter sp.]
MKTNSTNFIQGNLTKGEWQYSPHSSTVIAIGNAMKHEICTMNTYAATEIKYANASVIALSPKMYKYLIKLSERGDMEAKELIDSLG